jgi:hypothetical protein
MMLMMLMMLTRGRLLCCFAHTFLCPIGAPSYTERRKDGASDVVCVVVVAVAWRWLPAISSLLLQGELRVCTRYDRAVRSNDPRTIFQALHSGLVVISRQ